MSFDPPFPIGHLHRGEQDRIRAGDLNPEERAMLAKGEDPWAKFRGPTATQPETKSEANERQPTDEELIAFMSPKTRSTWENRSDLSPQQRAQIWQGNKNLWRKAQQANAEPPKRKGMEVSELERRVAEQRTSEEQPRRDIQDTYQRTLEAIGKTASEIDLTPVAESLKRVVDFLPTRPARSIDDVIKDAIPKSQSLADRIGVHSIHIASTAPLQPPASATSEGLLPVPPHDSDIEGSTLPPRWLDRFWWFRLLRNHPKISGGGGLALTFAIFVKAIDWQIDGAVKSAASAFLAAWAVLAIVIYVSTVWDKRRPVMSIVWVVAGVLMALIWWAYLPSPPAALTPSTTQVNPAPTMSPATDKATQPNAQPSVANAAERIPLDIAPETLLEYFEKYNEAQAEGLIEPHIGKWIELSGRVTGVRRAALLPREGDRTLRYGIEVTFSSRRADRPKEAVVHRALFDEQRWMDRAVVMKPKEYIKVRGPIKYVYFYGFYLEHGEIIE